jgi:16S rRNA (cytosine1402-N4)-methyltransferase
MALHHPVLSQEVIAYLKCEDARTYVDCTVGGGGHAARILEKSSPGGKLLGIDWDSEAITFAKDRLGEYEDRITLVQDNFSHLASIAKRHGYGPVDGILLDLGVSSFQIEDTQRGFSFRGEGPLDMRMDRDGIQTASDLVNQLPARDLEGIFRGYGEERWARRISRSIEERRRAHSITTTTELREIVHSAIPTRYHSRRIDPATKTFMALRIAVNRELENLRIVLEAAVPLLKRGGTICVISFHSLEDRIVKDFFRVAKKGCVCPPRAPQCVCLGEQTLRILTPKPVPPSREEIQVNPRARSAKLRAAERV